MATTKKQPAKKKPVAAKTTVRKTSAKPADKSFQVVKNTKDFTRFSLTTQTVYWLILGGVILVLGLWIIDLNDRVQNLYNDVEQTRMEADAVSPAKSHPETLPIKNADAQ